MTNDNQMYRMLQVILLNTIDSIPGSPTLSEGDEPWFFYEYCNLVTYSKLTN